MRRLLTPRWLLWHVLVAAAVVVFLGLARWQYGRAIGGNTLSWAYTLQWPLFAGFVVAMWVRTARDELRRVRDEPPPPAPPPIAPRPARPARRPRAVDPEPDDPELAAYNRYLAWLNANPDRKPSEYPGG